ncbi:hypothetical protein [Ketobacter sp.]|nr:MAG: hypothetical protein D6160_01155 [Ketobacter sp.]
MDTHTLTKFLRIVSCSLLSICTLPAWAFGPDTAPAEVKFNTSYGNTQGTLNWQIAGGNGGPNILSELTYRNVQFKQFQMSGSTLFKRGPLTNAELFVDYKTGIASDGSVQDSDYQTDNRGQEYSRSHSSANGSRMQDITLGAAYHFQINTYQSLIPMLAYTSKTQKMLMTEGLQVVDIYNPYNLGPFRNTLNSSYITSWDSIVMGMGWKMETQNHELLLNAKFHLLDYHAEADWNLRSDFAHPKSFEHWAGGNGFGLQLSYAYRFSELFSLWLNWYREDWRTNPGTDVVYLADGSRGTTTLNEVTWEATGFATGLLFRF